MKSIQVISTNIKLFVGVIAIVAGLLCGSAFAEGEEFNTNVSMEVILDTPTYREIMAKHVPDLMANPEIDQARVISLSELASYVPDQLTDEIINAIVKEMNEVKK